MSRIAATAALVLGAWLGVVCAVPARAQTSISGTVFEDRNGDGIYQPPRERGLRGVRVSNGLQVVATDAEGRYRLPAPTPAEEQAGFAIFVVKPATHEVPLDELNVPRFHYVHKPAGSPANVRGEPFRFGGLEPTGPLPAQLDFALRPGRKERKFKVVVSGDTQTYSNIELGYLRDTLARELAGMDDIEAVLIEGDVLGDDLSILPRFKQVMSVAGAPQYYVPGNHDIDFDAPSDLHSFDTFRREWGPEYYSFDIGDVHFVVLDDVKYPCTPQDNLDGLHGDGNLCDTPDTNPTYSGTITPRQLAWLRNDLAHVPTDKLVVLNMHIPIISFIDQNNARQMVDNQRELYEAVGCNVAAGTCARPLLALAGHTHTNEQLRPGESFEGWARTLDSGALPPGRAVASPPFPQIIVGAACGGWWSGDLDASGVPESWERLGAPRGYFILEFDGNRYRDLFKATGKSPDEQMSVDFLTPPFRQWHAALRAWNATNPPANAAPPVNINDLPDTRVIPRAELGATLLSVNVWNGSQDSKVYVTIDGRKPQRMPRTQPGTGENILETLDPFALKRQLMVARHAFVSTSGNPRAQGFELFRGNKQGRSPSTPRPGTASQAVESNHVWQLALPTDLALGAHVARIATRDANGLQFETHIAFEVVEQRLDQQGEAFFRTDLFEQRP